MVVPTKLAPSICLIEDVCPASPLPDLSTINLLKSQRALLFPQRIIGVIASSRSRRRVLPYVREFVAQQACEREVREGVEVQERNAQRPREKGEKDDEEDPAA